MRKRCWCFYIVMLTLYAGLLGRILYITRTQPAQVAAANSAWTVSVANSRGTIYDCKQRPIVNETKGYKAAVIPDERVLNVIYSATDSLAFETLRDKMSGGTPAAVALNGPVPFTDGLELFYVPVRYGDRVLAPHIVGYMDAGAQSGVAGIEQTENEVLTSYNGSAAATFYVNGTGRCLSGVKPKRMDTTAASVGGVVLTIDKDIQQLVENLSVNYIEKGAVIVMDPYSGDIKALASFPSFQPNTVAECIKEDNGALLNRGLALYDCGSVFKIVTAAAALENGLSDTLAFTCSGSFDVQGIRFHCHNRLGHHQLDMHDGFAESCNVYFIRLAQTMGADALYTMAQRFGFDTAISLSGDMGTEKPLFPSLSTLNQSPGALANLSFGQGYLMTSPLHIAQITATIANGGTMPTVQLIDGYVDEDGNYSETERNGGTTILSSETAATLQAMMRRVVTDGTGEGAAPSVCTAAGKTGTAETGQAGETAPVVQSWFTGYFPAEDPQYVVTVLAEDANNTQGRSGALFCEISNNLYRMNT